MHRLRNEIISFLQTQIERSENTDIVIKAYLPKVKQAVENFVATPVDAQEPLVLSLCATVISKFGMKLNYDIAAILKLAITAVLPTIKQDYNSHMEHRTRLFELLLTSITHGFDGKMIFQSLTSHFFSDNITKGRRVSRDYRAIALGSEASTPCCV